jgi:TonB family protein
MMGNGANRIMKVVDRLRGLLPVCVLVFLVPVPARAMQLALIGPATGLYLQETGAGAPLGKLYVPMKAMGGNCITMVSPTFPQTDQVPTASTVILRVVVWKSGRVTPMRLLSGNPALETAAMDAVRLWKYRPYARDGEALDVSTDIQVEFDPAKPGGLVTHPNQ